MPSALTQITPTAFSYIVHTPILDQICVCLSAWSIFECMFDYFSFSDIECMFGFCGLYKIRTRPPLYISPVFYITFIIRPTRGHYPLLRYFSFLFLKSLILMVFLFLPDKPDDSVFSFYFFFSLSLYSQFSSFFHFFESDYLRKVIWSVNGIVVPWCRPGGPRILYTAKDQG